MIARLTTFARNVFRRSAAEREMREEMALHLERGTERLVARGMSLDVARLAARREFGNLGFIQEEGRDARGGRWIDTTLGDLRYGARALRRAPLFTIAVVLSLGLGIGANTAIFGVIHTLILEPLPVAQPEQLVQLRRTGATGDLGTAFWEGEYRVLRGVPGMSLAAFSGSGVRPVVVGGHEEPRPGNVIVVDGNFFPLIGISPEAGRLLTRADDDAATPVVVLSHDLAVRHFGTPDAARGGVVTLNRVAFTVVGVTPSSFRGLDIGGSFGLAVPVRAAVRLLTPPERVARGVQLTVIGRTRDRSAARVAADRVFQRCCADGELAPAIEGRVPPRGQHVRVDDISRGIPAEKLDLRDEYSRALYLLMAGVAVLLLIACAKRRWQ